MEVSERGGPELPRSTQHTYLGNYHRRHTCSLPYLAGVPRTGNSDTRQPVRLPIALSLSMLLFMVTMSSGLNLNFLKDLFITECIKQISISKNMVLSQHSP